MTNRVLINTAWNTEETGIPNLIATTAKDLAFSLNKELKRTIVRFSYMDGSKLVEALGTNNPILVSFFQHQKEIAESVELLEQMKEKEYDDENSIGYDDFVDAQELLVLQVSTMVKEGNFQNPYADPQTKITLPTKESENGVITYFDLTLNRENIINRANLTTVFL